MNKTTALVAISDSIRALVEEAQDRLVCVAAGKATPRTVRTATKIVHRSGTSSGRTTNCRLLTCPGRT